MFFILFKALQKMLKNCSIGFDTLQIFSKMLETIY